MTGAMPGPGQMMTTGVPARVAASLATVWLLVGCGAGTEEPTPAPEREETQVSDTPSAEQRPRTSLERQVEFAKADLAQRTGLDPEGIEVLVARNVTWRDGSMGCPKPDRGYAQVLTPGVEIRLGHGKRRFNYHGSRVGEPFLCEPPGVIQSPAPVRDDGT